MTSSSGAFGGGRRRGIGGTKKRSGCLPMLASVLSGLAFALPAAAQVAGIEGRVTDTTGGVLPGVTVEVAGPALGGEPRAAVTGGDGRYAVETPPGAYGVRFSLPGFAMVERARVQVADGAVTTVDVEMRVGGLAEQVSVVGTGTAIDAPAINLPHAVAVVDRATLEEQGASQIVDLFKNLGASHGVIGEANSWYNADQSNTISETVANINLRGLGASRTLVLINGRRQTYVPARLIGGRFVDVNAIPAIAIGRIEVLKEGAAATYGSDAVGGVANFVTRNDFRGFELAVTRDQFAGAGDTTYAGIWGGRIGSSHAVFSGERAERSALLPAERDWALRPFEGGRGGWSSVGNPGYFYVPALTGTEGPGAFTEALSSATGFIDPLCEDFGGHAESWTCRFRYQPWDDLISELQHTRAFAEINGPLGNRANYHVEGLWAEGTIPHWGTQASYPPFPLLFNGVQQIGPGHPGRQAFCEDHGATLPNGTACSAGDWFFRGRPNGNAGPGRTLRRDSRTTRIAASVDGDLQAFGGRDVHFDVGLGYSRAGGNINMPGIYSERLFLAYRGFGGPDCGVGVLPDPTSAAGMALGPRNGAVAGRGPCMYLNPFSNAVQHSRQPGSRFENEANPTWRPGLANDPAMMAWLDDEVDLASTTDLVVADATLSGAWVEGVADYAFGYQYRGFNAAGDPNDAGDIAVNPCPIRGAADCAAGDRFGPYAFTNVHSAYARSQTVQRLFGEIALNVGPRLDTQLAANYEIHDVANSFDPKFGWRLQVAESLDYSLALRGGVQTTFRTPSLDDLNEDALTTLEYINETGAFQAVDKFGSTGLEPERAFTWNTGLILFLTGGLEVTADYWSYDFENVINAMPHAAITRFYADPLTRSAVSRYILCPKGRASAIAVACEPANMERVQVDLVNWPGVKTSGLDLHFGQRVDAGPGQLSLTLDGTWTAEYRTKALMLGDLELQPAADAAGRLNFGNPIAVPLPKWKSRFAGAYRWNDYSLASYVNYISSYEDPGSTLVPVVEPFLTWDTTFQWRFPDSGFDVTLYGLNLTGEAPPWADVELSYDGFTHDPKGRRVKLGVTYRFGG